MMASNILRLAIIVAAVIVSALWIVYGKRSHKWLWTIIALCWLIPVTAFFSIRFIFVINPVTLNLISLSLYLMAVSSLGGVAMAKLKNQREMGNV